MQFNLDSNKIVIILVSCLMSACASGNKQSNLQSINIESPIELKLLPQSDRREEVNYFSKIHTDIYELDQKVREKLEAVTFKTEASYVEDESKNGHVRMVLKTTEKEGPIDLNDLAFPEVNERIEFVFSPQAEVLYAGAYPESSVFFVPFISLPNQPVQVGDTWEMQKSWINSKTSIPLRLRLVSILKNIYSCGKYRCADIEVSGEVDIIATVASQQKFQSQISGRLLFLIDKGSLLWSEVKSDETFWLTDGRMNAKSCLVSSLIKPNEEVYLNINHDLNCDPLKPVNLPY